VPVHDGRQVDPALVYPDIGDVGAPHLVGPFNDDVPEQIRVDHVARVWFAQVGLGIRGFQPHYPHQPPDPVPADMAASFLQ